MSHQDWAALSREYRRRRGLKQAAIAQDFDVDQSTVSRWERGEREPSLNAKHLILNALLDAGLAAPDQSMQFLLEQSGSNVVVWDRAGRLRGYSPRFERELRKMLGTECLRNRPAEELLGGNDLVTRAIDILSRNGFFEGRIALAVFTFPPFLQPRRVSAGGLITASTFPIRLSDGELGLLSILDHDTFAPEPEAGSKLSVSWVSAEDGHSELVEQPSR